MLNAILMLLGIVPLSVQIREFKVEVPVQRVVKDLPVQARVEKTERVRVVELEIEAPKGLEVALGKVENEIAVEAITQARERFLVKFGKTE
jgi:hypothetical protein